MQLGASDRKFTFTCQSHCPQVVMDAILLRHILLVEDKVKLARLVELELSSEGYRTSVAHDGMAGLTLARESSPELVILDWMLPGLSGVEVCRRLRATGNKVPVILLTARD